MSYEDNPRKVYGKVEVIYSDSDISSIQNITTSGNSPISHPYEVYGTSLTPSVKACTMDGNAIMDGTYQMMDDDCIVGWWSDEFSDSNGDFLNPVILELFFLSRPIKSWLIIGDTKLDQYPVSFTIRYKRNDVVVKSETITSNNQVEKKVYPEVEDITSIEVEVHHWNKPNACCKILKFFEKLAEEYLGSDLKEFEVHEEIGSSDAYYNLTSDTMSVIIHNKDQKFNLGYLKNLLILDRKVKPYIGVKEGEIIQFMLLGTFYSSEWKISDDSLWLKCTAVDKLMKLQSAIYVGYPLTIDTSLYDIANDILNKAGFKIGTFNISERLKEIIIPFAYLGKSSIWDALQEIANASLCHVYINRNDEVIIASDLDDHVDSGIEINRSNMFSYSSNITLTDFANIVSVEYADIELTDTMTSAIETVITVDASSTIDVLLNYNIAVYDAIIETDNENLILSNFYTGINACSARITNTSSTNQSGLIKVSGYILDVTYNKITSEDTDGVRDFGPFEYTHPTSDLVQTSARAEEIAGLLLQKMKKDEGLITTRWRGNPSLELNQKYTVKSTHNQEYVLVSEYNKFVFNGGLEQETRGRKVPKGE